MSTRVWKYPLMHGFNTFRLPEGAEAIHVHEQDGAAVLWVRIDSDASDPIPAIRRDFRVLMTGEVEANLTLGPYIGTIHFRPGTLAGGEIVMHVFEVPT